MSDRNNADINNIPIDEIDVSDPRLYETDTWHPLFKRLRKERPIHYCTNSSAGAYWSVSCYQDIVAVELDHSSYSSAAELGGIRLNYPAKKSFLTMDPPAHTAKRKAVAPVATPTNLINYEVLIRQRTGELLDALPRGVTFDWVDRVSIELTTMMLTTLFGFPLHDRRKLSYWCDVAISDLTGSDGIVGSEEEQKAELLNMANVFKELWRERSESPPQIDLISMMAHNPATRDMSLEELIGSLSLLIVGGMDTTKNTMSGGLLALSEFPDEWAKLRADHTLVSSLVGETIRFQTPAIHMQRTATCDVDLRGEKIKKGDKVVVWYISGNRDESIFEEPDIFKIDRPNPNRHLAFGAGIHRCVGDRLAVMQLRIFWEEILKRNLFIEVVGPVKRQYSNFARGISKMPVRIHA